MAIWMVRAGKAGGNEEFALENNVACIGWRDTPDLSTVNSLSEMQKLYHKAYPEAILGRQKNHSRQLWSFSHRIEPGDYVVLPLKTKPAIAIGKCNGLYQYCPDNELDRKHTIGVEWINKEIPRSDFKQDLIYWQSFATSFVL
jgi:restriction system protein